MSYGEDERKRVANADKDNIADPFEPHFTCPLV